jgi:hypothetical protein
VVVVVVEGRERGETEALELDVLQVDLDVGVNGIVF